MEMLELLYKDMHMIPGTFSFLFAAMMCSLGSGLSGIEGGPVLGGLGQLRPLRGTLNLKRSFADMGRRLVWLKREGAAGGRGQA